MPSATIRFFLDSRGRKGEGEERSDGFLVFAGAIARLDETPSLAAGGNRQRSRLVASGRMAQQGDHTDDTLFKTPSQSPSCSPVLTSSAARVGATPAG